MSGRDPSSFGDSFQDRSRDADGSLELPLEMYFAEDRGDPETVAASESLATDVLDRVGAERGFVSTRERGLIRAWRGSLLALSACVLLGVAVVDRLGLAPWSTVPVEGPVSGLLSSTSAQTVGTLEEARVLRDQLLRVVAVPTASEPAQTVTVTLRSEQAQPGTPVRERSGGPYLTAEGFGTARISTVTTVIRFEDGFSVPAMAGETSAELRWPASRELTASVVSFDTGGLPQGPRTLSPAWYAKRAPDRTR